MHGPMAIHVTAEFKVPAAKVQQFERFVVEVTAIVREREAGKTLSYDFFSSGSDMLTAVVNEVYADAESTLDKFGFDAAFGGAGAMKRKAGPKNEYYLSDPRTIVGIPKINAPSFGNSSILGKPKAKAFESSRSRIGRSLMSGSTSI
jgi:quinol monooxygenase YgiN